VSGDRIPLRIAYAGTAALGALVLDGLLARGSPSVAVVVTRPDRPRGRHGSPQPSPVKESARRAGIPVLQPERLAGDALDELLAFKPGVLVVCAFGEIIRPALLDRLPALVVHPSAVPRWRGAAPVARALMAGETRLGVATLRMTAGVDEGPVGDLRWVDVPDDADAGRAYELIAPVAAESVLAVLRGLAAGTAVWHDQQGEATYAEKIGPGDRVIDWSRPAQEIVNQVRALSPAIGARASLRGRDLILWKARVPESGAAPAVVDTGEPANGGADGAARRDRGPEAGAAEVVGERLVVQACDGPVEIVELQAPGGRRMTAGAYLHGAGRWLAG